MKMKLFLVAITLLQIVAVMAQNDYDSLLSKGKVWTLNHSPIVDPNLHNNLYYIEEMKLVGDTVIEGIHLGQIYRREWRSDQAMSNEWLVMDKYIGQDGGKIYQYYGSAKKMRLDMDFSLQVGDKFDCIIFSDPEDYVITFVVTAVSDTIMQSSSDKKLRKCFHLQSEALPQLSEIWVEGIGSLRYGLLGFTYYFEKVGAIPRFVKCVKDDEILYNNEIITDIQPQKISKNLYDNNTIYDLNGHSILQAQKGIYIQNGKIIITR